MTTPTPEQFLGMPSTEDEEDEAPPESAATPGQVVENGSTWPIGVVWQNPEPDYLRLIEAHVRLLAEHFTNQPIPAPPSISGYEAVSADATSAEVARVMGKQGTGLTPADHSVHALAQVVDERELALREAVGQLQVKDEVYADLEAQLQTLTELIDEIKGIVKPSKSQVSLEVKAAIKRWANPVVEQEPTPHEEAVSSVLPTAQAEAPLAPVVANTTPEVPYAPVVVGFDGSRSDETLVVTPVQPAPTYHVEAWRAYAREVAPEKKWEGMNRSQIRTALGLSHPSESS